MRTQKIVIVCGYGCDLHPKYRQYLTRVARYVNGDAGVWCVIVSGGPTQQKRFPNTSEAAVMRRFLETTGEVHMRIMEDHDAYTSYTNMVGARDIMERLGKRAGPDDNDLVIFCDAIRALKVKVIAERVLQKYRITMETCDLAPRGAAGKQVWQTLIDSLAAYVPPVNFFKESVRRMLAKGR